jgi:SAM-dependent methyltransferase
MPAPGVRAPQTDDTGAQTGAQRRTLSRLGTRLVASRAVLNRGLARRALKRGIARRLAIRMTTRSSPRHGLVGPAGFWVMKRRFQFKFLLSRGLQPEHRVLDMGCGTLRGGIPLIDYLDVGNYVGVEARANVLEEGRRELAEARLEHKRPLLIVEVDPAQVRLDVPVAYIWAFSVLIHMPDEVLDACLGMAARVMTEDGQFYANVQLGDQPDSAWHSFPCVWRPRRFYAEAAARHGLTMEDVGTLKSLGHRTGLPGDQGMMVRFRHASISA